MIQNKDKTFRILLLLLFYVIMTLAFLGLNLYLNDEDNRINKNVDMNKMITKSALQGLGPLLAIFIYGFFKKK